MMSNTVKGYIEYYALHGRTASKFVYFLDSTGKLLILQNFLLPSIKTNIGIFLSIYLILLIYISYHVLRDSHFLFLYSSSFVTPYIILYRSKKVLHLLYKVYAKKPICMRVMYFVRCQWTVSKVLYLYNNE